MLKFPSSGQERVQEAVRAADADQEQVRAGGRLRDQVLSSRVQSERSAQRGELKN